MNINIKLFSTLVSFSILTITSLILYSIFELNSTISKLRIIEHDRYSMLNKAERLAQSFDDLSKFDRMNSQEYDKAKEKKMLPIDEISTSVNTRTLSSILDKTEEIYFIFKLLFILMFIEIILFTLLIILSKRKDKKSLDTANETIKKSIKVYGDNVIASDSDIRGVITYASVALCKISGYSNDELLGKPHSVLRHPDTPQNIFEEMWNDLKQEKIWNGEIKNLKKDGKFYWVRNKIIPKYDENNILIGYSSVRHDITSDKAKEEVMETLRQKEQQFFHQSRLAQMGEMISMIAHQWRQPLGAISATAANLKLKIEFEAFDLEKQDSRDECADYFMQRLDNINSYVKNLSTTIDDFRNFYKPNKSTQSITLEEVLRKALSIIDASLKSDNIDVIHKSYSSKKLDVHDNELIQVFLNIFKNAQDNFKEKEIQNPKLTIEVHDTEISITDNGGGIPQDIIEKIFDPYFSTKDDKNGTGLGLYMSKTIVEEHHNGKLEVFNTDDGVCFRVDLDNTLICTL